MWLVDRAQMRSIDQSMIDEVGVNRLALMELAGAAVMKACLQLAGELGIKGKIHVHIIAGKGHNGADGLVAARHLLSRGHEVLVWMAESYANLSDAGQKQYQAYVALGGKIAAADHALSEADLIVDALLGTGSRLPLGDRLRPYARAVRESGRPVVAVDIPSGIDASNGQVDPDVIPAKRTVALGFAKMGLFQHPAKEYTGEVVVENLSMPDSLAEKHGAYASLLTDRTILDWRIKRQADSHKGTFGKLGVVAGSKGMYGAARLAIAAAYRAGAGLVEYFAGQNDADHTLAAFPDETLLHYYEGQAGEWNPSVAGQFVEWTDSLQAVLLGPGLGKGFQNFSAFHPESMQAIANVNKPLILDADFLNALALLPDRGEQWFGARGCATIITPHPKEFGRLLGLRTDQVQQDRIAAARRYALSCQVVVVLKGAGTVIATPAGQVFVNRTGNHGLATAGTGDVLAGFIAGMVSSGYEVERAASLGVFIHGRAAELACNAGISEESLTASELLTWLGRAFSQLSRIGDPLEQDRFW